MKLQKIVIIYDIDRVDFNDGTTITYRKVTSTKDSPAVDIKVIVKSNGGIGNG